MKVYHRSSNIDKYVPYLGPRVKHKAENVALR